VKLDLRTESIDVAQASRWLVLKMLSDNQTAVLASSRHYLRLERTVRAGLRGQRIIEREIVVYFRTKKATETFVRIPMLIKGLNEKKGI